MVYSALQHRLLGIYTRFIQKGHQCLYISPIFFYDYSTSIFTLKNINNLIPFFLISIKERLECLSATLLVKLTRMVSHTFWMKGVFSTRFFPSPKIPGLQLHSRQWESWMFSHTLEFGICGFYSGMKYLCVVQMALLSYYWIPTEVQALHIELRWVWSAKYIIAYIKRALSPRLRHEDS